MVGGDETYIKLNLNFNPERKRNFRRSWQQKLFIHGPLIFLRVSYLRNYVLAFLSLSIQFCRKLKMQNMANTRFCQETIHLPKTVE